MRSRAVSLFTAFVCVFASCNDTSESTIGIAVNSKSPQAPNGFSTPEVPVVTAKSKIEVGTKLDVALATLDTVGATNESGWQWGSFDDDIEVKWRDISDGITLAIHFSKSTRNITALQLMYLPPNYDARGNYQIVDVLSMEFHQDKTYTVHFDKP